MPRLEYYLGLLTFGVAFGVAAYHYNKKFLDWLRFESLGTRDYIAEKLQTMFINVQPNQILLGQFVISFGLGGLVFLAFLPKLFPALVFGLVITAVGWKAPKPIVDAMYRFRCQKIVFQMIDGLSLMSNGLKSGLSPVQALGLVAKEMPNPIQQEFNMILSQNSLGVTLEECFNNFAKRVHTDDVEMFVTSVNILTETGGNLAETFDTIVYTIRERIKIEKKISAMVAQGFYQGMIVMAVPPILGVVFYQSDPEFMAPMFNTTIGWIIMMVVAGLEVLGYLVIRKIIQIDV
jgi:tight adherence protein B